MSKALTIKSNLAALEQVLIRGDLAGFNEAQRLTYVKALCKATGVNILFQPFDYIQYQGKTIIYPKRSCTEQLRAIHKINIKITSRERTDALYVVTCQGEIMAGRMKGKVDESIGCVNIKGLSGKELANALMIGETKAKRRMTLSICGLGFLDEIEIQELVKAENRLVTELAIGESEEKLSATTERPEFEKEAPSPSLDPEPPHNDEYKLRTVRGAKGKPVSRVPVKRLTEWLAGYDKMVAEGHPMHPDVQDDAFYIRSALDELTMVTDPTPAPEAPLETT